MIEKNIWQTYKYDLEKNPEYISISIDTWRYKNTEWSYNYLNDDDVDDFILDNFGSDWSNLINQKCLVPVMKADVWRLMALYVNGGIYADVDTACTDPIDNWIKDYSESNFICGYEGDFVIASHCFLSTREHPALENVLKNIYQSLRHKDIKIDQVYEMTGPNIFTRSILDTVPLDEKRNLKNQNKEINNSELFIKNKMHLISDPYFFLSGKVFHFMGSKFWNFEEYPSWNKHDEEIKNVK